MDPLLIVNNSTNDEAVQFLQKGQANALRQIYDSAFSIPYLMTSDERACFDALLAPRPTVYKNNGELHRVSHPIAATLQALAYQECYRVADGYTRVMDIGGSFLRTPAKTHLCTLVDDSRTDSRYNEGAFMQRSVNSTLSARNVDGTTYNHQNPIFCTKGAQNCNHPADYAYAVNVYDITLQDIAQIFAKHQTQVLDMWMFLPLTLISPSYKTDEKIYNVQYFNNDRALFSLGDNCNAYEHSTTNWRSYMTTTKIVAADFAITIEHKIAYGTFTQIRFVRTDLMNGRIHRVIDCTKYVKYIEVPDLDYYVNVRNCTTDPFLRSYNVPIDFYRRLSNWASATTDGVYTYTTFSAYAASIAAEVKFTSGNKTLVLHNAYDTTSQQFEIVKQSLFIIISVQRFKRTKTIAKAYKEINANYTETFLGWLYKQMRLAYKQIFPLSNRRAANTPSSNALVTSDNDVHEDSILNYDNKFVDGDRLIANSWFTSDILNVHVRVPKCHTYSGIVYNSSASAGSRYSFSNRYQSFRNNSKTMFTQMLKDIKEEEGDDHIIVAQKNSEISALKQHIHDCTTTKTVINVTGALVNVTDPRNCKNELHYNPPGDGSCGLHALKWLATRNGVPFFDPREKSFEDHGIVTNVDDNNWLDDRAIAFALVVMNIKCTIHQEGKAITNVNGGCCQKNDIGIDITGAHWRIIKCDCWKVKSISTIICDYSDVLGRLHNKDIVVIEMDDNYVCNWNQSAQLQSSVKQGTEWHGNITLNNKQSPPYIGVKKVPARNKKDYQGAHDYYQSIFALLSIYSNTNNATIYVPWFGVGRDRFDLCCFKTALSMSSGRITVVHPNEKLAAVYNSTTNCRHGGYKLLRVDNNTVVPPEWNIIDDHDEYLELPIQYPEHMPRKYQDLCSFVHDHSGKKFKHIVDLTAAPGHFYREHSKNGSACSDESTIYHCYHYVGDGYLKPFSDVKSLPYKKLQDLHLCDFKETLFIYDFHISTDDCNYLRNFLCGSNTLVCKNNIKSPLYYANIRECISNNYNVRTFCNDGTAPRSFEVFMMVTSNECIESNNPPITQTISDMHQHKKEQLPKRCNCTYDFSNINCTVSYTMDSAQFNAAMDEMYDMLKYVKRQDVLTDKRKEEFVEQFQKLKEGELTFECVNGMAGASKTSTIIRNTCHICTYIVTPYKAVADDIKNKGAAALTYAKYFAAVLSGVHTNKKYIILDECFAFHPAYVACIKFVCKDSRIILTGDDKQIDFRDYQLNGATYNIQYLPGKSYINTTNRCPKNITALFTNYIAGASTTSIKEGDVKKIAIGDEEKIKGYKMLTFTQKSKDEFTKRGFESYTVNAVQGMTFDKAAVYMGDITNIHNDHVRYIYTAASRVTTELVLYGDAEQTSQFYHILGSNVERALNAFDIIPHGGTVVESKSNSTPKHTNIKALGSQAAVLSGVESILQRIYKTNNERQPGVIGYHQSVMPKLLTGDIKISKDHLNSTDYNVRGKTISDIFFIQQHHNKNKTQVYQTAVNRYTKKTFKCPDYMVNTHVEGLNKFMKRDWRVSMLCNIAKDGTGGVSTIWLSVCDYLKKLQTKLGIIAKNTPDQAVLDKIRNHADFLDCMNTYIDGDISSANNMNSIKERISKIVGDEGINYNMYKVIKYIMLGEVNKIKDLEEPFTSSYHRLIQFHLKTQPKEIRQEGWDSEYKAGQGISAWSKLLNIIFSSFTRTFSMLVQKYIKDNVQLAYGKSDTSLQEFFEQYADDFNDPTVIKFTADFSEFDSAQEQKGIMSSIVVLKSLGFNNDMLDFYLNMRSSWTLASNTKDSCGSYIFYLNNSWMQHSGQPFTLDGNTLFNMSSIGACYELKDLICASFKGDDSIILCRSIKEQTINKDTIRDICGYKIKTCNYAVPEYIANIITFQGKFFPDVLRRTTRVLNKIHSTEVAWDETKKSVADSLDVVMDDSEFYIGCMVAQRFYQQYGIHISAAEVGYLCEFLCNIKHMDLDQIKEKTYLFLRL